MPRIVGTGVAVASAAGRGATRGYNVFSGTSMASPSVVGVAALAMDAMPALKEEPAALRARLMASAIKPDAFLGDAAAFPLDNTNGPGTFNNVYGLGKVSARTAVLSRDAEDGWTGGSTAFDMDAGNDAFVDILVPEGSSRLDVVLSWDEPPAETIAHPVLHDLDLWVDRWASCGDIDACGQYTSRSRIDNVEWVVIPDPPAGVYRLKVVPRRIHGLAPRAGLAWTVIRGESEPALAIAADTDAIRVAPDQAFDIEATLTTDSYVAAGANLRVTCRAEAGSNACDGVAYERDESGIDREDGLGRTLARDGAAIVVGEIGPDEMQTVSLRFSGAAQGAFRLDLSVSAWNAESASIPVEVVVGDPESDPPAGGALPPNDDFARAAPLVGASGETTFDLAAATPEPGEPPFPFPTGHPSREPSLWYTWTAPESGPVRFAVAQSVAPSVDGPGDYADFVVVQVFDDGPSLAGLEAAAAPQSGGGITFFAEEGDSYRLRLSVRSDNLAAGQRPPWMTLAWAPGHRPANDDYAFAAVIEGESGSAEGNNQGATTEPGEMMGDANPVTPTDVLGWAGSVWYRWKAPSTGDFHFAANRRTIKIAAFVGDGVDEARMVSGIPQTIRSIAFPATEGVEYRIGVATGAAYFSGAPFELSWWPEDRLDPGNDDFAAAAPTFGDFAFASVDFDHMTVEHGEPPESGVRSAWWTWQPANDGRYTWLASRLGAINDEMPLQMSVFAGEDLAALETVGVDAADETMRRQLAFDARAGTVYRVALGLPRDAAHTQAVSGNFLMEWGPTPENDDYASATVLAAMGGTVSGSTQFATTEKGEYTGTLGDASLWWIFEPSETTWMRFDVDGPNGSKLAVYRVGAGGSLDLELVTVSRELGDPAAQFRAEAGVRYVIRYGTYFWDAQGFGGSLLGEFDLSWSPTDAPAFLRYLASIESGDTAEGAVPHAFGPLGDQAFNADGTELYVWTPAQSEEGWQGGAAGGLLVFARDPATGALSWLETLSDPVPVGAQLHWDDAASALIAASCDGWMKFAAREGGGIEYAGTIDGAPCPTERLLAAGDFVHILVPPYMIETYRFDEGRDSLDLADVTMIHDLSRTAAMTADGENVYLITLDRQGVYGLVTIERDPVGGDLHITSILSAGDDGDGPLVEGLADVRSMAVHGTHLFVIKGQQGADTLVFDLADRANPAVLGGTPDFLPLFGQCEQALARGDVAALDVACSGLPSQMFSVQVGGDGRLRGTDLLVADGQRPDAFGNRVPPNGTVLSVGASPDGRHLYAAGNITLSTFNPSTGSFSTELVEQLLAFERVHEPVEAGGDE